MNCHGCIRRGVSSVKTHLKRMKYKAHLLSLILLCTSNSLAALGEPEWYLQRPDVDIFVKEVGKGSNTVIVIHGGFGANHEYMIDAVRGLEKDYRFVFYDQRGSLLSPTAKENLSFPKNVEDLHALVRSLRVGKVRLLAHSMGTLVAMEFAKQHPELVANVVLTGSVPLTADSIGDVFSEGMKQQAEKLQSRKEVQDLLSPYLARGYSEIRSIEDIERSSLSQQDLTTVWRINYAAVNIYDVRKFKSVKGGRAYYKGAASAMSETVQWKYDYRESLAANGRTSVIMGDHDYFDFGSEILIQQLRDYPSIKLEMIRRAGHIAWIDRPVDFKRSVRRALEKQ